MRKAINAQKVQATRRKKKRSKRPKMKAPESDGAASNAAHKSMKMPTGKSTVCPWYGPNKKGRSSSSSVRSWPRLHTCAINTGDWLRASIYCCPVADVFDPTLGNRFATKCNSVLCLFLSRWPGLGRADVIGSAPTTRARFQTLSHEQRGGGGSN